MEYRNECHSPKRREDYLMSNYNPVYHSIWLSNKFNKLDSDGKLIFLYLLTNSKITQTGIYSIMLRQIACDTGLSIDIVKDNISKMQLICLISHINLNLKI